MDKVQCTKQKTCIDDQVGNKCRSPSRSREAEQNRSESTRWSRSLRKQISMCECCCQEQGESIVDQGQIAWTKRKLVRVNIRLLQYRVALSHTHLVKQYTNRRNDHDEVADTMSWIWSITENSIVHHNQETLSASHLIQALYVWSGHRPHLRVFTEQLFLVRKLTLSLSLGVISGTNRRSTWDESRAWQQFQT